ncbi:hypothetical protein [Dyella sp. 2HG41-7]|uniref:hypothetical protein n=1 Tax=Dyella sp. 2HG41-7 TaxID=2883239 RepID=UPI001F3E0DF4|nr:hypothetical protein [Dyella sp. 2HG41-7]
MAYDRHRGVGYASNLPINGVTERRDDHFRKTDRPSPLKAHQSSFFITGASIWVRQNQADAATLSVASQDPRDAHGARAGLINQDSTRTVYFRFVGIERCAWHI